MTILKSRTSYLIDNSKEVIEIKKQCERQGLAFHILPSDYDNVGVVYVHNREGGLLSVGWNPAINSDPYPDYKTIKWSEVKLPTQDFKINLSNMTEAEKEVAKGWLVEVAESCGKVFSKDLHVDLVAMMSDYKHLQSVSMANWNYEEIRDLPELFLTFSRPAITSWSLPEEKSEKELQLEELVGKLQQQLEEAQQKLEAIR